MLNKDEIRILKYLYKHGESEIQESCYLAAKAAKPVHEPYLFEDINHLDGNNCIYVYYEYPIPGERVTMVRLSPVGKSEIESYKEQTKEKWVTRVLSITALVLSAISIIWQIFA